MNNVVSVDFALAPLDGDAMIVRLRRRVADLDAKRWQAIARRLKQRLKSNFGLRLGRTTHGTSYVYGAIGEWYFALHDEDATSLKIGRACTACGAVIWLRNPTPFNSNPLYHPYLLTFYNEAEWLLYLQRHGVPVRHEQCPDAPGDNEPHD